MVKGKMPEIRKLQKTTRGQYTLGVPKQLVHIYGFEQGQPFEVTISRNRIVMTPVQEALQ